MTSDVGTPAAYGIINVLMKSAIPNLSFYCALSTSLDRKTNSFIYLWPKAAFLFFCVDIRYFTLQLSQNNDIKYHPCLLQCIPCQKLPEKREKNIASQKTHHFIILIILPIHLFIILYYLDKHHTTIIKHPYTSSYKISTPFIITISTSTGNFARPHTPHPPHVHIHPQCFAQCTLQKRHLLSHNQLGAPSAA